MLQAKSIGTIHLSDRRQVTVTLRPQWWVSEMGNWGLEGKEEGVLKANDDWLVADSNYCGGDIPYLG